MIAAIRNLMEELVSKTSKKKMTKARTNSRKGAEHRTVEPVNPGISESSRSVVADREKTSPSREPSLAQSQLATSGSGGALSAKHPLLPPSSDGPLKFRETEGKFEGSQFSTFGTSDSDLCVELFQQLNLALPRRTLDPNGNHALAALYGISPRDTVEGMLATQMVVAQSLAMEFLSRAGLKEQPPVEVERHVILATKLLRTFVAQVEALDRHRGKGEQKMNVEQVHIHKGAQGIVGPVSHQGSLDASVEDHGRYD